MTTKLTIEIGNSTWRIYQAKAQAEGIPVEALVQSVVEFWVLIPPAEEEKAQERLADVCACCGGTAWLQEITICEDCYEDKLA